MKKLFLMVLASATIFSCSSDDDGPSNNGNIQARWNPIKTTVKVGSNSTITQNYEGNEPGCNKDYVEFADGGVLNRVAYFRDGDDVCQASPASTVANWSKTDDMVTITGDANYAGTYEITRLTNSELRLEETDNTGGIETVTTIYFEKAPAN